MKLSTYTHETLHWKLPKTHQNRFKNQQKSFQNRPLESLWDPLATLLEPRALYVPFMYPIWLHFWPQKGPQNRPKIDHFLDLFLNDFLEPLFHAFGLHFGSQNDPKMRPKRVPTRNQKIIDFAVIYYTWATLRGPENHHFGYFFGTLFEIPFRDLFLIDFWHFWGPFWDPWGTKKAP